jgi:hypothetical protein
LAHSNQEIQKIVAFEGAFEKLFFVIDAEVRRLPVPPNYDDDDDDDDLHRLTHRACVCASGCCRGWYRGAGRLESDERPDRRQRFQSGLYLLSPTLLT